MARRTTLRSNTNPKHANSQSRLNYLLQMSSVEMNDSLEKNLLVNLHNKSEGSFSMSEEQLDFEEAEWDIEEWGDEWDDFDDDDDW